MLTCDEVLRRARGVSTEDLDSWETLCELADWIEQVLGQRGTPCLRVNVHDTVIVLSRPHPKMDGSHVLERLSTRQARLIAAELLHAIDKAERNRGDSDSD